MEGGVTRAGRELVRAGGVREVTGQIGVRAYGVPGRWGPPREVTEKWRSQRNWKVIRGGHGQWRGVTEEDWKSVKVSREDDNEKSGWQERCEGHGG